MEVDKGHWKKGQDRETASAQGERGGEAKVKRMEGVGVMEKGDREGSERNEKEIRKKDKTAGRVGGRRIGKKQGRWSEEGQRRK